MPCFRVLLEDNFSGHQGNDLYDLEKTTFAAEMRFKKTDTLRSVGTE